MAHVSGIDWKVNEIVIYLPTCWGVQSIPLLPKGEGAALDSQHIYYNRNVMHISIF